MSLKKVVNAQYQEIVDRALSRLLQGIPVPKEGWIKTVRKALGMSTAHTAKKMNVSQRAIYKLEDAEQKGGITLEKMNQVAESMGCQFVYAIVPHSIHTVLIQPSLGTGIPCRRRESARSTIS